MFVRSGGQGIEKMRKWGKKDDHGDFWSGNFVFTKGRKKQTIQPKKDTS